MKTDKSCTCFALCINPRFALTAWTSWSFFSLAGVCSTFCRAPSCFQALFYCTCTAHTSVSSLASRYLWFSLQPTLCSRASTPQGSATGTSARCKRLWRGKLSWGTRLWRSSACLGLCAAVLLQRPYECDTRPISPSCAGLACGLVPLAWTSLH